MALHMFSTVDELRDFWACGLGFLLNRFRNCLHRTSCATYRGNPPGLTNTGHGFDTWEDAMGVLRANDRGWYGCPICRPEDRSRPASNLARSQGTEAAKAPSGPRLPPCKLAPEVIG